MQQGAGSTAVFSLIRTVAGPTGPTSLQWAPQFDLRGCGLMLVAQCLMRLRGGVGEDGEPSPWLAELLSDHGLSMAELIEASSAFVRGLDDALKNPGKPPQDCLDEAGFAAMKPTAKTLVFSQFGYMFTGAVLTAIHATTDASDTHPAYLAGLEKLAEESRKFADAAGRPAT